MARKNTIEGRTVRAIIWHSLSVRTIEELRRTGSLTLGGESRVAARQDYEQLMTGRGLAVLKRSVVRYDHASADDAVDSIEFRRNTS